MSLGSDLFGVLGPLVSNRAYPLIAPDKAPNPLIVYSVPSVIPDNDLDGATGLEDVRIQVDGYTDTYSGREALGEQIKAAMNTAGWLCVFEQDLYEDETLEYRVTMDFKKQIERS